MINSIRNTVLAILNKNNYGYLSPSDFNLYAKQAQIDVFKAYFPQYNDHINKENARISGTDYANEKGNVEESIENFLVQKVLTHITATNQYYLPSLVTTGDELFRIQKVLGYATGPPKVLKGEAEKVTHGKITMLLLSPLTSPSVLFPAYTVAGNKISVYPELSFISDYLVECIYIRMPKAPKWTFMSLLNGEAMFDQTQPDYQDFEVNKDDEVLLVVKILQYAGIEIREADVYTMGKQEQKEKQD